MLNYPCSNDDGSLMAERGEPWPAGEEFVGQASLRSRRALVVASLLVALAAGIGVAQALPVPDSDTQRVAWWLVAETAGLAAVSAMQLLIRRRRRTAALAPLGTALVIVLTAVAVIIAAPAPEPPRSLVVTLGSDNERGISPEATVEAAAVFAPVPPTTPTTAAPPVVTTVKVVPPTTAASPTSVAGAGQPSPTPGRAVPTVTTPPPPTTPPTAPPTTPPTTTVPPTTAPATTVPATTVPTTVPATASALVSLSADRSAPVAADGLIVAAGSDIYFFVESSSSVTRVRFWIGNKKGTPYHTESRAPFDLAGGANDGAAAPFTVPGTPGPFTISVEVTFKNGSAQNTKVTLQLT